MHHTRNGRHGLAAATFLWRPFAFAEDCRPDDLEKVVRLLERSGRDGQGISSNGSGHTPSLGLHKVK